MSSKSKKREAPTIWSGEVVFEVGFGVGLEVVFGVGFGVGSEVGVGSFGVGGSGVRWTR